VATIDPSSRIVCDAGPLIHLDELGCLDLLSDFSAVLVPSLVWDEVQRHRPQALSNALLPLRRHAVESSPDPELKALFKAFALDAGEQAALVCMKTHPGAILLTDDAAARLASRALGYRSHGCIGILLRAIRRGQRTRAEILNLLKELPVKSTLHIRPDLLLQIIKEVEEPER
jgi:predicted nucleic acid-binding protein